MLKTSLLGGFLRSIKDFIFAWSKRACLFCFLLIAFFAQDSKAVSSYRCEAIFDDEPKAYFSWDAEEHGALILHLIDNEKIAIRMAYYQCDGNKVGNVLFAHLRAAARRGVDVEFLLDAWNPDDWIDTPVKLKTLKALAAEGVKVRYFNDVDRSSRWARFLAFLKPSNFNRMHDKLAMFESQKTVVTGDRMPQNMNFRVQLTKGTAKRDENSKITYQFSYLSVMAAVQSRGVYLDSREYFDKMFALGTARDVSQISESEVQRHNKHWDRFTNIIEQRNLKSLGPEVLAKMTEIDAVDFVSDVPGKKAYGAYKRGISKDLLNLIDSAKVSLHLFSPYMNFTEPYLKSIRKALKRGVKVYLVVPSWDSIDTPITLQNWEPQARYLQNLGVQIIQHSGPDFMHAKVAIVDSYAAFVGSFNFNPRSTFTDQESGVIIWDKEFVAGVMAFEAFVREQQSTPYEPKAVGVLDRIKLSVLRKLMQWNLLIRRQI